MPIRLPKLAWLLGAAPLVAILTYDPLGADQTETNQVKANLADMTRSEANSADPDLAVIHGVGAAAVEPGPAFPVGSMRFDIECSITHSTLPDWVRRRYEERNEAPPLLEPGDFRWSVDLEAMVRCGPGCTDIPSFAVAAADAERIVLDWAPGHTAWLRRSDGNFFEWYARAPVETRSGHCRRAPFTEFPTPDEGDRWNYPDTRRAIALGARRFDLECEVQRERWGYPPAGELPNQPESEDIPTTSFRQSVDLDAMLYCPQGCRDPQPIRSAGPGLIRFADAPGEVIWLDRQLGRMEGRRRDATGFEQFYGHCTQVSFTPFPGSGRTGEPGWRPTNPHKVP